MQFHPVILNGRNWFMGFPKKHKSLRRLLYICAGTTSTQESLLAAFIQKIEMENFPINFSRHQRRGRTTSLHMHYGTVCLLCCRMFHSVKHDNNDIINVLISLWVIAFVSWGKIVCFKRRMLTCIRTLHAMAELFDSSEVLHGWSIILCEELKSSQKIQYLKRLKNFCE